MALKINVPVRTNFGESDSLYARIDMYHVNRMLGILQCGISYFLSKEDADEFKITEHNTQNPLRFVPQFPDGRLINQEDLEIKIGDEWQFNKLPYTFSALLNEETTEVKNVKVKTLVETVVPEISFDNEGNQVVVEQTRNIAEYIDKQIEVKVYKIDFSKIDEDLTGYSYQLLERLIGGILLDHKIEKI